MSLTKRKTMRARNRAERRAKQRRTIAHLVLHGFFPVSYNSIAQTGGPHVYLHVGGKVLVDADHPFKPKDEQPWPHYPILLALAARVGMPL